MHSERQTRERRGATGHERANVLRQVKEQEERVRPKKASGTASKEEAANWRSALNTSARRAPRTLQRREQRTEPRQLPAGRWQTKMKRDSPPRKRAGDSNHRRFAKKEPTRACSTCCRTWRTAFRRSPSAWRPHKHEKRCPRARSSGTPKAFPASSWRASPEVPESKRESAATLSSKLKRHEAPARVPRRLEKPE